MKVECSKGCGTMISFHNTERHTQVRRYALCSCPISGCAFKCPSWLLANHLIDEHKSVEKFIYSTDRWLNLSVPRSKEKAFYILHNKHRRRVFLLLKGSNVASGTSLSIVSIRFDQDDGVHSEHFEYLISLDEKEERKVKFISRAKRVKEWSGEYPSTGFLYVPDGDYGEKEMKIKIKISGRITNWSD